MIYFYRHSCQMGQQSQFSAFRCSERQGNQSEAPFMSVPPQFSYLIFMATYCAILSLNSLAKLQLDPSTERQDLLRPPCSLLLLLSCRASCSLLCYFTTPFSVPALPPHSSFFLAHNVSSLNVHSAVWPPWGMLNFSLSSLPFDV